MQENDKSPIDFENIDFNDVLKAPQENNEVFSQKTNIDVKKTSTQDFEKKQIYALDKQTLDKIDYIYKTLKAQKLQKTISKTIKFLLFFWILFLIFIYIPNLSPDKKEVFSNALKNYMINNITEIVKPMVEDMTKDLTNDMINSSSNNSSDDVTQMVNSLSWTINTNSWKVNVDEVMKKYQEFKQKQNLKN